MIEKFEALSGWGKGRFLFQRLLWAVAAGLLLYSAFEHDGALASRLTRIGLAIGLSSLFL